MRPAPHIVKAKKREIAVRHRNGRVVNMATLRMPDINRLIAHRFGSQLPDNETGRLFVRIAVHHLAQISGEGQPRILAWIAHRAPWMREDETDDLLDAAFSKPIKWRSKTLGEMVKLTDAERTALSITTIAPIDVTTAELKKRRKEKSRERQAARRRAAGAIPRKKYEAGSISHAQPWIAAGMSRSTWYRKQQVSPVN
jgi:hypothetical protein